MLVLRTKNKRIKITKKDKLAETSRTSHLPLSPSVKFGEPSEQIRVLAITNRSLELSRILRRQDQCIKIV